MTRKRGAWALGGTIVLAGALYMAAGSLLVAPARKRVAAPHPSLHARDLRLPSPSGATLAAWLFVPPDPAGAIVLLHGIRANRGDMLARARLLSRAGFVVLVPDLQAHGESTGRRITFGALEAEDAAGCVRYLRQRFPSLRVGGVGVSLGGAAFVLSGKRSQPDALVLEAVFPSIAEAAENRVAMRLGRLSRALTPLLLLQLPARLGVSPSELRPVDAIRELGCPVLVLSGTADRHTTEAQTRALFAAANEPKHLWLVPGASHDDLLRHDERAYSDHVLSFLRRYLTRGAGDAGSRSGP